MSHFRLAARPGLVKAGRTVKTGIQPIIAQNQSQAISGVFVERQPRGLVPQAIPQTPPQSKRVAQPPIPPLKQVISLPQPQPQPIKAAIQSVSRPKDRDIIKRPIISHIQKEHARQESEEIYNCRDILNKLKDSGRGRTLIIVANGPSVNEADLVKFKNNPLIDLMTVNKPDSRIWPTNYWIFCDQSQYQRNEAEFSSYGGIVINTTSVKNRKSNQALVKILPGRGFSKNLITGVHIGRSTTYTAMQVAYWMGYDAIYLFGVDMCLVNGNSHFYGINPDADAETRVKRFNKEADFYFEAATKHLSEDERKKYIFCSLYNQYKFIDYFERLDQKQAVNIILNRIQSKIQ